MFSRHSIRPTANAKSILSEFLQRFRRSDSRALDLLNLNSAILGAQDDIFVNRQNLIKTANEEILGDSLDPRITLCVNFHGEGKLRQTIGLIKH